MTIEELNPNDLKKFEFLINESRRGEISYLSNNISEIVANLANITSQKNAIVLNSHFGEISAKLKNIENVISVEINSNYIEFAKYLNPDLIFINEDPLRYSVKDKFDLVASYPILGQKLEIENSNVLSEILYIEKALNLLSAQGSAIFILPSNFLNAQNYNEIRNFIITNFGLSKIVSIPQEINNQKGFELSIIEIKKISVSKTAFYSFNCARTYAAAPQSRLYRWV